MAVKTKTPQQAQTTDETATKRFDSIYMTICICAAIVILTATCFGVVKGKFIMFHPDRVAKQYCDSAVVGKDPFNALKYTTLIKNNYLGTYFRENYVKPNLTENVKAQERTPEELGVLKGQLAGVMDAYYAEIITANTEKTLDTVLKAYTAKYAEVYQEIFGEPASSEDDMVTCFEASVSAYSSKNGLDAKNVQSETTKEYSAEEVASYKANLSEAAKAQYAQFNLSAEDITAVCEVTYTYTVDGQTQSEVCTVVQIGAQWYVDISA